MRDITEKIYSYRVATASAVIRMKPESVEAVRTNNGPKPDVPATARAAAYLAVKNTPAAIPHCHPLPVEAVAVDFEYDKDTIKILLTAKTIYKTGCEVEAMHGVAIAALTIYDMLKPVDKDISIENIQLELKSGGKSGWNDVFEKPITAAVIVNSDSISAGKKEDKAGKVICEKLKAWGVEIKEYVVIPDEIDQIKDKVGTHIQMETDLIITTGGTGLGPRDVAVEAIRPMIEREIPGIMEAARVYGQQRTPYAMLSRGIAGLHKRTLIITAPGSTGGATETMDALFPWLLHIFKVLEKGYRHGQ